MLDSVSSPITRRVYNLGLNEFFAWYELKPRPGFTKSTVSAWRVDLEARRLGSVSINVRITADQDRFQQNNPPIARAEAVRSLHDSGMLLTEIGTLCGLKQNTLSTLEGLLKLGPVARRLLDEGSMTLEAGATLARTPGIDEERAIEKAKEYCEYRNHQRTKPGAAGKRASAPGKMPMMKSTSPSSS